MLAIHQEGNRMHPRFGKSKLARLIGDAGQYYGAELAQRGFVMPCEGVSSLGGERLSLLSRYPVWRRLGCLDSGSPRGTGSGALAHPRGDDGTRGGGECAHQRQRA